MSNIIEQNSSPPPRAHRRSCDWMHEPEQYDPMVGDMDEDPTERIEMLKDIIEQMSHVINGCSACSARLQSLQQEESHA